MLRCLTQSKLKHFYIVQNENTSKTVMPCSSKAWLYFKQYAPNDIQIHLEGTFNEIMNSNFLIQPDAFIQSIKCKNVIFVAFLNYRIIFSHLI